MTRRHGDPVVLTGCLVACAVIIVLDWLTPAGVVVGILLCVPIVAASLGDRPGTVYAVSLVSLLGFALAAVFGRGPVSPVDVWGPNRLITILALVASSMLALRIQGQRLETERAREQAAGSRDTNRLLLSLLAHDLRSPLVLASQTLGYVRAKARSGEALEDELVSGVDRRLQRSLGRVEGVLRLVDPGLGESDEESGAERTGTAGRATARTWVTVSGAELAEALAAELDGFGVEATYRGMRLDIDLTGDEKHYRIDGLLVQQAASILVDNALRHGGPGTVGIRGRAGGGELSLTVENPGPAPSSGPAAEQGSGLGLGLCRALVSRAGGTLVGGAPESARTVYTLRLPLEETRP